MLGKIKKQKLLILSLALVLLIGAGSTIAYLISVPPGVENKFQPTVVSCTVLEDFDKQTKSNVRVQNTGDIDAYIRAEIVVNWKNDAGEVYGAEPKDGADYNIDIPKNTGWFEKGGFYYYENVVNPKGTQDDKDKTGVLINSCTPVADRAPAGYYLSVEIIASAIQEDGVSDGQGEPGLVKDEPAVTNAWGVTVKDGKLTQ